MVYRVRHPREEYDWTDYNWQAEHITVFEEDKGRPTGVLDQHGNEIWDVPETVKFGFQPARGNR